MLDPTLPEKQRARRRLVGAIALVMAAVVVLPLVLDSRPKPVTDDIAIAIPARPDADSPGGRTSARSGTHGAGEYAVGSSPGDGTASAAADLPPDSPPESRVSTSTSAETKAPAAVTAPNNTKATSSVNAARPAMTAAKPATDKSAAAKPAGDKPSADATVAGSLPATPATPGSRYVVQLGSFTSDVTARDWVAKLKNIGVPAYIERSRQADGSEALMLRAGPFADRKVAQAAVLKVRQAGLAQAGR